MRKNVTKLLILLCSTFATLGFASCNTDLGLGQFEGLEGLEDYGKYTVELDSTGFNPVVPYMAETVDCTGLTLIYKMNMRPSGIYETKVPVTQGMITSAKTDAVGEQELVLSYSDRTVSVPYTVKYQVDITAAGETLDTQYVLTADEVVLPTEAPEKNGYLFAYWKTDVLDDLNENVTVDAHYYDLSLRTPALRTLDSVYAPDATLASLTLPSNANGKWVFVDDLTTLIGGAGTHTFEVEFIRSSEDMAPQANKEVTVNVAKKTVEITVEQTSFVYDGEEHFPTPTLSDPANYTIVGQPQINAGSGVGYSFTVIVEDDNYQGVYSGSYEITKPEIEVIVDSATIAYGEEKPMVTYSVVGFDQEKLALLDIQPEAIIGTNVGEYPISVTVGNTNVNATVKNGTLTILHADYDWADPILSTNNPKDKIPAIYEDTVSTVAFIGEYLGEWTWKNPDQVIDNMEGITATAVFIPQNTNYKSIERDLLIDNVIKRTLNVIILNNVYTYTGAEFAIEYEVQDASLEGVVYENLTIEGNDPEINAATYEKKLVIVSDCYEGWATTLLTIAQAEPQFELNASSAEIKWTPDLTLENSGIVLGGSGIGTYEWTNAGQELYSLTIGQATDFTLIFTPDDVNYHAVERTFTVTVIKADAAINGLEESYETTYDGNTYMLRGITASHGESDLVYTYILNGETVDEIKAAGVYTVMVTLPESTHYSEVVETSTVTVKKADVNTDLSVNATYEDTLADVTLPTDPYGIWTWQDDTQSVGDAGVNYRTAIFTATNANYNDTQTEVSITVAKKLLYITATDRTYTYNGLEQSVEYTVQDANEKLYTDINVEGNVAYTNFGTYSVSLTINEANYEGNGLLTFMIGRATVVVSVADPTPIAYGEAIPDAVYSVTVGGIPATAEFIELLNIELVNPNVTEAGEYSIGATVTNNNITYSVEAGRLTVNKAYLNPETPSVGSGTYSYALSTVSIEQNADNGVWTWKTLSATINTPTTYTATVVFTPNETNRYAVEERTVTITVDQKELSITVTADEFNYNTEEQTVRYYIGDGHSYNDVEVIGEPKATNAGKYPSTITIVDDRYCGQVDVTLVINSIDPEDEDFSNVYTKVWYNGLTLADIALPKDYRWLAPETSLNVIGTDSYDAVYEKIDEYNNVLGNYNTEYGKFSVTVNRSDDYDATMTETYYETDQYEDGKTYELSDIITLNDLDISHTEDVTLSYKVNGKTVDILTSAGTHTVEVTVSGSTHYNGKVVGNVTVFIDHADIEEVTDPTRSAYYETAIKDLALPTEGTAYGTWAWISVTADGDDALTRWLDVDTYTAVVKFTAKNKNFNDTTATFTVTINAKPLTISAVNKTYTYIKDTSQHFEYVIKDSEGKVYTDLAVSGDIAYEDANTYPLTITIANSNYTGELSTNFVINPTTDSLADGKITIPTWVYDKAPTLEEKAVSGNEVYFVYSDTIDGNYTQTIPNKVGPHYVKAKTNGSQNYWPLDTDPVEFWILEDTVYVTVGQIMATKEFIDADIQLMNADLPTDARYTVQSSDSGFDVGEYNATLALKPEYKDNYQFTNGQDTIDVKFEIEPTDKNGWDITPSISGWEFIEGTKVPEMNKGLAFFGGVPDVKYVLEGTTEELDKLPEGVPAGTHTAIFRIAPHANYNGLCKEVTFVVDPQDVSISIPWLDYNGEPQNSGLTGVPNLYSVEEDVGGTEVDDVCYVVLKLLNTKNYEWVVGEISGANNEFTKIYYSIHSAKDNNWKIIPSIEGWTYKTGNKTPQYEARYGNDKVIVEYLLEGETKRRKPEDKDFPEHIPAGDHKVYFRLDLTDDYNGIPEKEVPFTVEKASYFKEDEATTTTGVGVYSNALSTVTLVQNNPNGTWAWETPDAVIEWTMFPTSETLTATAVFTPNDTHNYHVQTRQVVYTVEKMTLTVTAGRTETKYNGKWQYAAYTIEERYTVQGVDVLGGQDANTYEGFVTIVDERYQGSAAATLFIDKDTPEFVEKKSYTVTWVKDLKLSAVTGLPTGCEWVDGTTSLDDIKTADYEVVYNKGRNYYPVEGKFSVTVIKSDVFTATMTKTEYTTEQYEDGKTYELSDIITLNDLSISHKEGVSLSYKVNNETVDALTSAGTHKVEVTVSGSTHYNGKVVGEVTVFVPYADIEEVTDLTRNPDYETAIEKLPLPTEGTAYGYWTWISVSADGDDALTRWLDAGKTYTAVAKFTATNKNFNDTDATFTVTIGRKTITATAPTIEAKTYKTESWVDELKTEVLDTTYYTVSYDESAYDYTSKGTHKVTLTATGNYRWGVDENGNDITVKQIDFVINQATNVTVTAPTMKGWTYAPDKANVNKADGSTAYITVNGQQYSLPENVIEYRYSTSKGGPYYSYEDIVIKNATTYYVKAFVEGTPDYAEASSTATPFDVERAPLSKPNIDPQYYTGKTLTPVVYVEYEDGKPLYEVTPQGDRINKGYYNVSLTLTAEGKANYYWQGEAETTLITTATFEILQATATITTVTISDWEYKQNAVQPTIKVENQDGKEILLGADDIVTEYYYYADSTPYGATAPKYVDDYYVIISISSSKGNYTAEPSTAVQGGFSITKKYLVAPTVASQVYANKNLTPVINVEKENDVALYGYDTTATYKDVKDYNIVLTLTEDAFKNYYWKDQALDEADTTVVFKVTEATTKLQDLSISGWEYDVNNKNKQTPTATAILVSGDTEAILKTATITYKYSTSRNGEYTSTVPDQADTYYVKAYVAASAPNYSGCETANADAVEFKITKQTYSANVSVTAQTYTGQSWLNWLKEQLPDTTYYTVSYDSNDTYIKATTTAIQHKVTLTTTNNYRWGVDENGNDITVKQIDFVINQATNVTVTAPSISGWTYDPNSANVNSASGSTAYITYNSKNYSLPENVIEYRYSTSKNGTYTKDLVIKDAASYYVKAFVEGTSDYVGASSAVPVEFKVTPATPTVTVPTYADTYEYKFIATSWLNAPSASVGGSWSFGTPVFDADNDGESTASVAVTFSAIFTPTDTVNYNIVSTTATVNLKASAHIGSVYYSTIELALTKASSGQTVMVCLDTADDIWIMSNCTIPAGVTLSIPYSSNGGAGGTAKEDAYDVANSDVTDRRWADAGSNAVVIKSNVTVIVKGSLYVRGATSGGNGGNAYAGHTYKSYYADLLMETDSKIEVNGELNVRGFVRETESNNGSQVLVNSGGSIYQPFVLRDFRGGSYMYAVYKEMDSQHISAFNQFELPNITSFVHIAYGGALYGYADLWANSQPNRTTISFIGKTSSCLIQMNEGAYVTAKYNFDATQYAPDGTGICDLDIYGGATINKMELKINVGFSVTVSTEKVYFPISWRFDIGLHNGTYEAANRFKLMPGAVLTLDNATLNVSELIVYDETFTESGTQGGNVYNYYATDTNTYDENGNVNGVVEGSRTLGPAQLILTGASQITATNLAGDILVQDCSKATISVTGTTSMTTYEGKTILGSSFVASLDSTTPVGENLRLYSVGTADNVNYYDATATGMYYYTPNEGWYTGGVKLTYNTVHGTVADTYRPDGHVLVEDDLPTLSETYYTFGGWYLDAACTQSALGATITADTTLYAKWTAIEYEIVYNLDGATNATDNPTKLYVTDGVVTLVAPTHPDSKYKFVDWYLDAGFSVATDMTVSVDDLNGTTLYLYAKFTEAWIVSVYGINDTTPRGYAYVEKDQTLAVEQLSAIISQATMNTHNADTTQPLYYTDKWCKEDGTEFDFATVLEGDIALYAGSANKTVVTHQTSYLKGGTNNEMVMSAYGTIFYVTPSSTFSIIAVTDVNTPETYDGETTYMRTYSFKNYTYSIDGGTATATSAGATVTASGSKIVIIANYDYTDTAYYKVTFSYKNATVNPEGYTLEENVIYVLEGATVNFSVQGSVLLNLVIYTKQYKVSAVSVSSGTSTLSEASGINTANYSAKLKVTSATTVKITTK